MYTFYCACYFKMITYITTLQFLSLFLSTLVGCLESPQPELLLHPRNFNPHPYNEGGRVPPAIQSLRHVAPSPVGVQARTGPVLFPPNPEDGAQSAGVDPENPYAGVARKQKGKLAGRFLLNDHENNINPRVYSGLANYAAKVLKKPATTAQHNGFPDPSLAGHKKNYAFSYTVHDQATGDDFSHSQSQSAAATNGEYRVKLPDGRVQIVSYTADNNGYKADVKYAEDEEHVYHHGVQEPLQHHQQQKLLLQVQQVQPVRPVHHVLVPDYEYYDEQEQRDQGKQLAVPVYDDSPYQADQQSQKYQPEYVSIYPEKNPSQYLADKVRIYPNSVDSIGSHVQQKVAQIGGNIQSPQKLGQIHAPVELTDRYTSIGDALKSLSYTHARENILGPARISPSTIAPPHFSQVYITTPKYSVALGTPRSPKPTSVYYKRR